MKNISIHPLSALLGASFLAVPLALVSFQAQSWPRQVPFPVSVQEMPDPHNFVQIREEDGGYTVPTGRLFVLTGLGTDSNMVDHVWLFVDGVRELGNDRGMSTGGSWDSASVSFCPPGFAVSEGRVITLQLASTTSNAEKGRAWGYLVDA